MSTIITPILPTTAAILLRRYKLSNYWFERERRNVERLTRICRICSFFFEILIKSRISFEKSRSKILPYPLWLRSGHELIGVVLWSRVPFLHQRRDTDEFIKIIVYRFTCIWKLKLCYFTWVVALVELLIVGPSGPIRDIYHSFCLYNGIFRNSFISIKRIICTLTN